MRGELLFQKLSGDHLFLTGGTGFFGRWLLEAIAKANQDLACDIRVTVLSRDPGQFLRDAPWFRQRWLSWIVGDVRDFSFPKGEFGYLIHAATDTSARAASRPMARVDSMVNGTRRVLDFAVERDIPESLYISSGAVYGTAVSDPRGVREDSLIACDCTDPRADYGEAKRMAELLCALTHRDKGLRIRIARCFAFSGPVLPLRGHFALGNFVANALFDDRIDVRGDGTAVRSYLYAGDLIVWLLTILLHGRPMRPYNVGSDQAMSICEIAERVARRLAPSKPVKVLGGGKSSGIDYYLPNIERARYELGLDAWTSFDEAVGNMASWATD